MTVHAFQDTHGLHDRPRFVLAAFGDSDVSESRWLSIDAEHAAPILP